MKFPEIGDKYIVKSKLVPSDLEVGTVVTVKEMEFVGDDNEYWEFWTEEDSLNYYTCDQLEFIPKEVIESPLWKIMEEK